MDSENGAGGQSSLDGKQFPFIMMSGHSKPDKESRRRVRKHVMQEFAVTKRKNLKKIPLWLPPAEDFESFLQSAAASNDRDASTPLLTGILADQRVERIGAGRSDPFVLYPIELDQASKRLVDFIFDPNASNLKPYRDNYIHISMQDAAAFYQLLANTALQFSLYQARGRVTISPDALAHHSRAMKCTNERLDDPEIATNDGTIAAVLQMAVYNNILQDFASWNLHMNGLRQILTLRGGIDEFGKSNQRLRLTISWHDITGSANQDSIPLFPFPEHLSPRIPPLTIRHSPATQYLKDLWPLNHPRHHEVTQMIDDLHTLEALLQAELIWTSGQIWTAGIVSGYLLGRTLSRLLFLQLVTNMNDPLSGLQEAIRLGALLYLAEIKREFGVYPVSSRVQLRKLKVLFKQNVSSWSPYRHLKIWLLTFATLESEDGNDRVYFVSELSALLAISGVKAYDGLRSLVQDIFWCSQIHDKHLVELWCELQSPRQVGLDRALEYERGARWAG